MASLTLLSDNRQQGKGLPVNHLLTTCKQCMAVGLVFLLALSVPSCRSLSGRADPAAAVKVDYSYDQAIPGRLYFTARSAGHDYSLVIDGRFDAEQRSELQQKHPGCTDRRLRVVLYRLHTNHGMGKKIGYGYFERTDLCIKHDKYQVTFTANNRAVLHLPEKDEPFNGLSRLKEVRAELTIDGQNDQVTFKSAAVRPNAVYYLAEGVNFIQKKELNDFAASISGFDLKQCHVFELNRTHGRIALQQQKLRRVSFSNYTGQTLSIGLAPVTTGQHGSWNGSMHFQLLFDDEMPVLISWGSKHYSPGLQERRVKPGMNRAQKSEPEGQLLPVSVWLRKEQGWVKSGEYKQTEIFSPDDTGTGLQLPEWARYYVFTDAKKGSRRFSYSSGKLKLITAD